MSEALAVNSKPADMIRLATDVAGLCKEIATNTSANIQGKKYVQVEGWQAIATAHGCVASARDVERVEGGFRAVGEVRRIDNGMVIATAEGFLGDDEPVWAKRPEYAKRAMCQTRAISRACRSAFAHVVVMMRAGLETTPAEEVPAHGFDHAKPVEVEPVERKAAAPKTAVPAQADDSLTGIVARIAKKPTAKGGTRYGFQINGTWVNTFDDEFAKVAEASKENGTEVSVTYKETKYGKDIVEMTAADAPADTLDMKYETPVTEEAPF